jgi:hypothetical protein
MAQSAGTFTPTGDMTTPRLDDTATLLADGTVLIVGGQALSGPGAAALSSAELYDPRTGTFKATGDLTMPRFGHTATLLPDGKVLIAGGATGEFLAYSLLASAELYDPATKTFTPTGDMTMGRSFHAATLLLSGRVLIVGHYVGGYNAGGAIDPTPISAELYDPSTGTFTRASNMAGPGGGATLLASGRVLITPDYFDVRPIQDEIYDPSTGKFSSTVNQSACCESTATLLMNGQVLIAYGTASGALDGIAELYDPASGIFTATGNSTSTYRGGHTATLLADGNALLAGGGSSGEGLGEILFFAGAEIYDPAKGTFGSTGSMQASRWDHTATLLNDGRVLIAGGTSFAGSVSPNNYSGRFDTLSSAELYTPAVLAGPPVLLSLSGDGKGQGAIQHAGTYRIASATDPAVAGEYLSIYLTGLADGSLIPPQVAIGGRLAEITFFGNVSGYLGLNVINVRMPSGVGPGPAVSVRLTYLSRPSNAVTIGVQ